MQTIKTINGINYYYTKFFQIKKNGKKREINSPCVDLKAKQRHLNDLLGPEIETILPSYVIGFRKNYNLKKNGDQHLGKKWVVNLDIKDFFPSITQEVLEKELVVFKELLTKHEYLFSDFIEFVILNKTLPQGSPTSPLLSNIIGYFLIDKKVYPYLKEILGDAFSYTRYADDITISFDSFEKRNQVKDVVDQVINMVESDGLFKINRKKINIMHNSQKQVVTGVVVNQKTSLGKKEKLKYRAIVHKIKTKEISMDNFIQGKLAWLNSVDPEYYMKITKELFK